MQNNNKENINVSTDVVHHRATLLVSINKKKYENVSYIFDMKS